MKRVLDHESSEIYRNSQTLSSATADDSKINEVLDELLQTEANYLRDIRFTATKFAKPLRELLAPHHTDRIFSNLSTLLELHDSLASQLPQPRHGVHASDSDMSSPPLGSTEFQPCAPELRASTVSQDEQDPSHSAESRGRQVAEAFIRMQPYFKSYSTYCANYPYVSKALPQARSDNPSVAAFLLAAEQMHAVTLAALLFRPVQRMCVYPLLWQQALKHAPKVRAHFDPKHGPRIRAVGRRRQTNKGHECNLPG